MTIKLKTPGYQEKKKKRESYISVSFRDLSDLAKKHLLIRPLCVCVCMLSHFSLVRFFATFSTVKPTRLLCPWYSPGKNAGVSCHALLQGIFPTQGSNPGLSCYRWILYHLSHQGSPVKNLSNKMFPKAYYVEYNSWKML